MAETRREWRRLYRATIGLVVFVVAIDTVIWVVTCRRLDDGARDAASSAGWTLSAGVTGWGGWPVAAEVTLPDVILRSGPDIIPPLSWTATHAVLRVAAWHPTVLTASASGAQTLTVGAAAPLPFTTDSLLATFDLTAQAPVRIAAMRLQTASPAGSFSARAADLLLRPDGLSANFSGIILPGRAGMPITPPIETLRFDGRITPPIEPQPTALESAQRWRANNGKLEVSAISLRWGSLDATGEATLTLDDALQPAVTGHVTAAGLGDVIEQFVQTSAMTRPAATAAKAMLTILSAPTAGGPVTLPMTLHDRVVTVARIPLLRLAPLQWD